MKAEKISSKGKIIGVVGYIGMLIIWANTLPCSDNNSCSSSDILLSIVIAVGLLAPAYIAAVIATEIFPDNK